MPCVYLSPNPIYTTHPPKKSKPPAPDIFAATISAFPRPSFSFFTIPMQIGISPTAAVIFFLPFRCKSESPPPPRRHFLPFRCKSESPAEIPAFAGMVNSFFLIPNFYHSDANRNLPRRHPIPAAEFPPPRLAPDICRGRNEYGGVYSAPPPPDSRRRIPASPPSFPRTRESIFTDKPPRSRRFFRCTPLPFPRTRESVRIALRCKLPPLYSAPPPLFLAAESPPPRRHSRERGNPFLPTNPRVHLVFLQKKFAEIPKLISPNRFQFRGNDGVFSRNSAAFAGMKCFRFCGKWKFIFGGIPPRSPRHSRESGNPFLPTNPRIHLVFFCKKNYPFHFYPTYRICNSMAKETPFAFVAEFHSAAADHLLFSVFCE